VVQPNDGDEEMVGPWFHRYSDVGFRLIHCPKTQFRLSPASNDDLVSMDPRSCNGLITGVQPDQALLASQQMSRPKTGISLY
jgi:hypothetical protein